MVYVTFFGSFDLVDFGTKFAQKKMGKVSLVNLQEVLIIIWNRVGVEVKRHK